MKKSITKEVVCCDKCGEEVGYSNPCMECGIEMCYDCRKIHGVEYNHAVHFSGSNDGLYCKPCDVKLTKSANDKRHNAYLAVKSLRDELKEWSDKFKKRQNAAEDLVRSFSK